ncbi:MAG: O-antigen ligase family protein [Microgenomates group bacterium]|nr:O-antigen ligase family protein [Microgenomates group bacterium]
MKKLTKWLNWLDKNIIKILATGLIFLIPLYPKLPLKMVNFTYVAIRIEDIYIAFCGIVFLIQFFRKKIIINKKYFLMFVSFWIAVFISLIYGIYVQKNLVYHQLSFLHALRRVEYMSVFFLAFASLKERKDIFYYLNIIIVVLFLVSIYGIGQKFLGWPAVQTMNPEYAKGYLLVLDANARISSTFAGHYDLAAYLVFLMPITLGLYIGLSKKIYFFAFFLALSNLVLTASRASYISYLITIIFFLIYLRKPRLLIIVLILTVGLTLLSNNLTKRISRTFQQKNIFINSQTGETTIPRIITPDDLPVGNFVPIQSIGQKLNTLPIDKANLSASDIAMLKRTLGEQIKEDLKKSGKQLNLEEINALIEANIKNIQVVNTIIPDISFATRLQVEWPRAIKAFLKNPFLGTGPGSLTEASDNDYLRWLGEFGLMGTSIFVFIIFSIIKEIYQAAKKNDMTRKAIFFGFIFGVFALLINATYIDVFEASKVAYTFWFTAGIFIADSQLKNILKKTS